MKWLIAFTVLIQLSQSLHFYMDTSSEKCFIEELGEGTTVVGKYRIDQYQPQANNYSENPSLGLHIMVDEMGSSRKRIKDFRGGSSGSFSFRSAEMAGYRLCLSTNSTGWFSHDMARVYLDLVIGDAAEDEVDDSQSKEKLSDLARRVRELNHRITDVRREQQYQRSREVELRDLAESANSKALWWTLFQLIVIGTTAVWQSRHLKGFFEAKKLV